MADEETPAERDASREIMSQVAALRKAEEKRAKELFAAYASLAWSPSGSIVIEHLRAETEGISYRPGRDAAEVAFHEGRRSIVRDILANVANGRMVVEQDDLQRSDLQAHAETEQEDVFIP